MSAALEASQPEPFPSSPDGSAEIAAEMLRINAILRRAVKRFRRGHAIETRNGLAGLAVFDEEVDRFLDGSPDDVPGEADTMEEDRPHCDHRICVAAAQGIRLPIEAIRQRFALSGLEIDALLLCIAAELHPGYGRVFAYLNNDLTRPRPSLALIVNVLSANWSGRVAARRVLAQGAPLFRWGLLVASRAESDPLNSSLAVDPRILEFVLGDQPRRGGHEFDREMSLQDLLISPAERDKVQQTIRYLQRALRAAKGSTVVVVSGAPGGRGPMQQRPGDLPRAGAAAAQHCQCGICSGCR